MSHFHAFPTLVWSEEKIVDSHGGLTMRQYFAAAALTGMLANGATRTYNTSDLAKACFNIADAMIVEGNKRNA